MSNKELNIWLAVGFVLLCLLAAVYPSNDDEQVEIEHYCAMVKMYKKTNGEYGWPAYDGEKKCTNIPE